MPDAESEAAWQASLQALRREVKRVTSLLRSIDVAPDAAAVGQWNLAEVAAHLAQVWVGVPGMARGDWSEMEAQLGEAVGAPATVRVGSFADLSELTDRLVQADRERDLLVLADRIQARSDDYFATCAGQDADVRRRWLVEGVDVPTASFTDHLLSENVLHGYDIATAAGRSWRIEPAHARMALEKFLVPIVSVIDPRAAVKAADAARFRATYQIHIRGGGQIRLRFDNESMYVEPLSTGPVDCHISADPVALLLVVWSRQSLWSAIARAKLLAWGRRPWLALRLPAMLDNP